MASAGRSSCGSQRRARTQADFAGEPAVIYFGFTHCPDICPTSMYTLAEALAEPDGYDVQPILITVDPERDTPARMGEYTRTQGFPPGLVGSERHARAGQRGGERVSGASREGRNSGRA